MDGTKRQLPEADGVASPTLAGRAVAADTGDKEPNVYGLKEGAREFPMMVVLSFVYPCNALCPHCPFTNSNIRKEYADAPYMPEKLFKKIADEAGQYNSLIRLTGGGEPMLHPKGTDLIVYAKEKGCRVGLVSNGSMFDEENTRRLLSAGVDMIEFSVDAANEEQYSIYRKGLSWPHLLQNARRMVALRNEMKAQTKIVGSCVHQKGIDIDEVERFWCHEIGFDNLIRRKYLTWGVNTTMDADLSADPTPYLDTDEVPCPFLFERLNIDTRGNVQVCGYDISANTSMGNVHKDSIKDIWLGEGFEYYRSKHLNGQGKSLQMCAGCPDWKYRSWTHNYWKVMKNAEKRRSERLNLNEFDDFQSIAEISPSRER